MLASALPDLQTEIVPVPGPRPDRPPVSARIGLAIDRRFGIVELAEAAGLARLAAHDRDPERTGTAGVGEMLDRVLDRLRPRGCGAKADRLDEHEPVEILLALGGSATVDGGIGALRALGVEFDGPDAEASRPLVGGDLASIRDVRVPEAVRRRWQGVRLRILADVRNPLAGTDGAARIFGPQKGAGDAAVARLDAGLAAWGRILASRFGVDPSTPGAGAAGGIGFALAATLGGAVGVGREERIGIEPGFDAVADVLDLESAIASSSLVITSEGRLDATSFRGKVVGGVLELADRHRVPVATVPGSLAIDLDPAAMSRFIGIRDLEREVGPTRARAAACEALRSATASLLASLEG